jgi:lipopolysaccharide transport system permease protein
MSTESYMDSAITATDLGTTIDTRQDNEQQLLARQDILDGIKKWRIWLTLSYQDVKLRYRRSILGPFWITISMAITTYSMGYLYGHLFHTDLQYYFPFLVSGMLAWGLISSQISDLTEAFSSSEGLIKQIKLPYSLYIHRSASRNIIIFLHNILVIVPILLIFHQVAKINLNTLLLIPGVLINYVNAIAYGTIFAILGARYRDIVQIIRSLIQIAFFLTPIMWNPSTLPEKDWFIVAFNPFYAFVELIRKPLLGMTPSLTSLLMVSVVTIVGIIVCMGMFTKYRSRIVYWL